MLLQRCGNGGFTAGREPREPDSETLLAAKIASFGVCKGRVPCYVPIFIFIFEIVWIFSSSGRGKGGKGSVRKRLAGQLVWTRVGGRGRTYDAAIFFA